MLLLPSNMELHMGLELVAYLDLNLPHYPGHLGRWNIVKIF